MNATNQENAGTGQLQERLPLALRRRREAAPRIPFEDITKECRNLVSSELYRFNLVYSLCPLSCLRRLLVC